MRLLYLFLLILPLGLTAQNKVGINTDTPLFDLDVRGTDDTDDGGELQLGTPSQSNFLRFFGGRLGDRHPFMAFHDDDTFHIVTTLPDWSTYTRRLTLTGVGDLGIGIENPTARLDILGGNWNLDAGNSGDLRIGSDTSNAFRIGVATGGGGVGTTRMYSQGGYLLLGTNNSSHMAISTGGRVGIGTTNPLAKLDISAQGDSADVLRLSTERPWVFRQYGTGALARLSLQPTTNSKEFEILSQNGSNRSAVFLAHNTYSKVFLVPDAGEVGIGTPADPVAKLHVVANSLLGWPQLRLTEIGEDYARVKMENDANPGVYWDIAGLTDSVTTSSRINFFYNGPGGSGDRMTILGNGNIGIGTINPAAKVDIVGGDWNLDAGNPGDLRIGSSASNALRIGVVTAGGGAGTARVYSHGGSLILGADNTSHLTITTSGNVGIGTTNPGNKLRIHGNPTSTAHVLSVSSNYSGTFDVRAVEGFSVPAAGYGFGGYFEGGYRGVRATGQGSSYTGLVIGLEANAYGTAGTRTGLFARATGGTTNWAGYFAEGNVYITNELRIGSGATNGATGYKVAVDGKIIAEGVRVQLSGDWPDYVFADNYELMPLDMVEASIQQNKHLPGVPSAREVEESGIDLGEMQTLMMEKIEELTLHVIQMHKRIQTLETENATLRKTLTGEK